MPSTYGELSMSSQKKLPAASQRSSSADAVLEADVGILVVAELRRLHRDLRVEPGRLHEIDHLQVVIGDLRRLPRCFVMFSPSRVRIVLMPGGFSALAASIASSMRSPGMNFTTERRTNFGAHRALAHPRRWSTPRAGPCASRTWIADGQSAVGRSAHGRDTRSNGDRQMTWRSTIHDPPPRLQLPASDRSIAD